MVERAKQPGHHWTRSPKQSVPKLTRRLLCLIATWGIIWPGYFAVTLRYLVPPESVSTLPMLILSLVLFDILVWAFSVRLTWQLLWCLMRSRRSGLSLVWFVALAAWIGCIVGITEWWLFRNYCRWLGWVLVGGMVVIVLDDVASLCFAMLVLLCSPWRFLSRSLWSDVHTCFVFSFQGAGWRGTVPHDGATVIAYHGTSSIAADDIERNGFKPSLWGMLGAGVYISRDLRKVRRYANKGTDGAILRLRVDVGCIVVMDEHCIDSARRLPQTWYKHGFDTAWVPQGAGVVPSNMEEACVNNPACIQVIGRERVVVNRRESSLVNLLMPHWTATVLRYEFVQGIAYIVSALSVLLLVAFPWRLMQLSNAVYRRLNQRREVESGKDKSMRTSTAQTVGVSSASDVELGTCQGKLGRSSQHELQQFPAVFWRDHVIWCMVAGFLDVVSIIVAIPLVLLCRFDKVLSAVHLYRGSGQAWGHELVNPHLVFFSETKEMIAAFRLSCKFFVCCVACCVLLLLFQVGPAFK